MDAFCDTNAFHDLTHKQIFQILEERFNNMRKKITNLSNIDSKMKRIAESKSLAKMMTACENLFEKLHIHIDDNFEKLFVSNDFTLLTHDEMLFILNDARKEQEDIINDIESKMSTDSKSTSLRNELYRAYNVRDFFVDIFCDFELDTEELDEYLTFMSS